MLFKVIHTTAGEEGWLSKRPGADDAVPYHALLGLVHDLDNLDDETDFEECEKLIELLGKLIWEFCDFTFLSVKRQGTRTGYRF